jgi:hypothetical protein
MLLYSFENGLPPNHLRFVSPSVPETPLVRVKISGKLTLFLSQTSLMRSQICASVVSGTGRETNRKCLEIYCIICYCCIFYMSQRRSHFSLCCAIERPFAQTENDGPSIYIRVVLRRTYRGKVLWAIMSSS